MNGQTDTVRPSGSGTSMQIAIDEIKIGDRFRKDFGDLEELAESIDKLGLLQPIGITEDRQLVFGERRLRACRDELGWTEIDVRVVDLESIVEGERAENEVRKDFSFAERVAIGRAVEGELLKRDRRGRPSGENPPNSAVLKGKETRQLAAERAGFGGRTTYENAKLVEAEGSQDLIEAVDNNVVSISAAARLVKPPMVENDRDPERAILRGREESAVESLKDAEAKRDAFENHLYRAKWKYGSGSPYVKWLIEHQRRPDTATARTLGKLMGKRVPDHKGVLQPPLTKLEKEEAREKKRQGKENFELGLATSKVGDACEYLAEVNLPIDQVLDSGHSWDHEKIDAHIEEAVKKLSSIYAEWKERRNVQS